MAWRRWLVLAAWVTVAPALASETQMGVVFNGLSYHLPRENYFNERNTGYGIQLDRAWGRQRAIASAGTFLDSYYTQANYIGAGYNYRLWDEASSYQRWHFDAGGVVLAAQSAGYSKYYRVPVLIAPLPWVSFGNERMALNLMFAPALNEHYASVFTAQVKFVIF